jgi:hypothetical protein
MQSIAFKPAAIALTDTAYHQGRCRSRLQRATARGRRNGRTYLRLHGAAIQRAVPEYTATGVDQRSHADGGDDYPKLHGN